MSAQIAFQKAAPTFSVTNVEQAIAYFTEALGFERRFVNDDDGPVYAIVGRDAIEIHLELDRRGDKAGKSACCVFVAGIEAIFQEMQSRGARIRRPLEVAPYGLNEFVLTDIDGNIMLVGERTQS